MADIYISIEAAEPATDGSELVILDARAYRVNDEEDCRELIHTSLNIPADYMQMVLDYATNAQKIQGLKYIIEHYGFTARVPYSEWPSSPTSWNYTAFIAYDEAMDVAQAEFDALNLQSTLQCARFLEFVNETLSLEFKDGFDNEVKFKL